LSGRHKVCKSKAQSKQIFEKEVSIVPFFLPEDAAYNESRGINMNDLGHVILVGNKSELLNPICDILSAEGYQCARVPDTKSAETQISSGECDLVIVGIEKNEQCPGGVIDELFLQNETLPIIIIAESVSSDLMKIVFQRPIVACLTSPIDNEELKNSVSTSIRMHHVFKTTQSVRGLLHQWETELETVERTCMQNPRYATFFPVKDFIDISFFGILGVMKDIRLLTRSLVNPNVDPETCHMMNCPRLKIMNNALHETIDVLEITKNAFKSRELGTIRKKLEGIIYGESDPEKNK
jgi:AmiR/NasT family two-component response regulator